MKLLGFKSDCNKSIRKKLLSFGLTPGVDISIIRTAPLGDPIEIKVRGYSLSLRKTEFDCLILEDKCGTCFKGCK